MRRKQQNQNSPVFTQSPPAGPPWGLPSMRAHPSCCEGAVHPLACSVTAEVGRGRSWPDVTRRLLGHIQNTGEEDRALPAPSSAFEEGGSLGQGGSMPLAQQRCDGGVTRWWVQGLEGRRACQGAWEVLQLGLSVHPVTMSWSCHAGMVRSLPSRSSCKAGAYCH